MATDRQSYAGREQTQAKHFILRKYLQALAFKVLRHWDVTYVDGFSGPWKAEREDYGDTSFMIAINVLKDAQQLIKEQTGHRRRIRCFFSENDPEAYAQLEAAVRPHHRPADGFEIQTFCGKFEDAVPKIQSFIGGSFPLIFIDPTGWTGYPFAKIAPLFQREKCEVLINFMYAFVRRFLNHPDEKIIGSLDPILGGPGWQSRLDADMEAGLAVEKLFRSTLRKTGSFDYVVSTRIEKSTEDRPHFFLAYGTKDRAGLKAFRDIEHAALREHARNRSIAKERKREDRTGSGDLFADFEADVQEASIESVVAKQKLLATLHLTHLLSTRPMLFSEVTDVLLQAFMLRETNVKDICVEMSRSKKIANTWGNGGRKPQNDSVIQLITE
ncbi:three-Cys-motif partner protein TcmP [Brevundimonas sp.]